MGVVSNPFRGQLTEENCSKGKQNSIYWIVPSSWAAVIVHAVVRNIAKRSWVSHIGISTAEKRGSRPLITHPCCRAALIPSPQEGDNSFVIRRLGPIKLCRVCRESDGDTVAHNFCHRRLIYLWAKKEDGKIRRQMSPKGNSRWRYTRRRILGTFIPAWSPSLDVTPNWINHMLYRASQDIVNQFPQTNQLINKEDEIIQKYTF